MGQFDLLALLSTMPGSADPNLIAGPGLSEDASAYRLGDGRALVQTIDYFTPVVDDPYRFGQIAAANALSDLYAAGARPAVALALAAFPAEVLPLAVLEKILRGGADKVAEAGASVTGGHTIDHDVPIYGLAATGFAREEDLTRHGAARPGDEIVLTKPLGIGVMVSAGRADSLGGIFHRRWLSDDVLERLADQMAALNAGPSRLMPGFSIRAATDVTGFGLLGHAWNLMESSGTTAVFRRSRIPIFPGAREVARKGVASDGSRKNFRSLRPRTQWRGEWNDDEFLLLADAQTSGGLLVCVPGGRGEEYAAKCRETGAPEAAVVGSVIARGTAALVVEP
ncbi:MAG: selenide, water dikinase SelD [Thermoanaerobaculia bacterium]